MPAGVVKTARDEELWNKAKKLADDAGHKDDWDYIMGVYQKMKGEACKKKLNVLHEEVCGKKHDKERFKEKE
jgi:hypothetical protein